MFPRRRRPLLGAALIVGASRSAAKHEVQKQSLQNEQAQMAADRAAEKKVREQEEMARRNQLAIDEAIAKERSRTEQTHKQQTGSGTVPAQPCTAHGNERAPPYVEYSYAAGHNTRAPQPQPNISYNPGASEMQGANFRYCANCGYRCQLGDRFCSGCGQMQPTDQIQMNGGQMPAMSNGSHVNAI